MDNLISGKEALNAWFDGESVFVNFGKDSLWLDYEKDTNCSAEIFKEKNYKFKLKPRTITINGIEVPAPFEPKDGELYYHIDSDLDCGFNTKVYDSESDSHKDWMQFGAYRNESDIEKLVDILRKIFK